MLDWVLNTHLAMKLFRFLNNIRYHFDTNLQCNSITKFLNVQLHISCYLSSLARALLSLKVILLFYLKYYKKQSQTWDIFSTSKLELFVKIGICKIIFCRLMILYTSYECQFVTGFIPFQVNLQTSKIFLFVTIAIPNVVFCQAMVLQAQFFRMNFLLFCVSSLLSPYRSRWFQLVPGSLAVSRWFQLVLGSSSSFQVIQAYSSSFLILVCTVQEVEII